MLCGSDISKTCAGATVTMNEVGWQRFTGEAVSTATFMVTLSLEMGAEEMTYNVKMGLNSLRCALVNMGDNTWTLIGAAYHAAKQFGQEDQIKTYVDEYYPYICTCTEDVQTIKESLQQAEDAGVSVNENKGMFTSCSEDAMGIPSKSS